ncbi:MAG: transglycosylase domain-containing protein [Defluviitaleaceae bacterium]|nr:transglycosylase domain-containing protein [Defluviitaleaceae bacterium]
MDYSRLGNMRRRRRQNSQTIRIRNKISLLFLRVTLAAALVGIFALPAMGLGAWQGVLSYAPELLPHGVRHGSYASEVICSQTGEVLHRIHSGINRTHVTLDDIPQHVIYAFIAIEDERFFDHNGVDVRGIGRAVWRLVNPAYNTAEGASTITQQLIKNRLERFDSDLTTKLQEQYLAVRWERELTELLGCTRQAKYYILEEYLNTINLGRTNHGVQAAAQFYFGIDVGDLSIVQAASIAAITQNPTWLVPDRHPDRNWVRTQLVLDNMLRLEFITEAEHNEAINTNVFDTIVRNDAGEIRDTISPFDCFTDALFLQLRGDLEEAFGLSTFEAEALLFTGGLRIYSTQDLRMQAIVDEAMLDDSLFPSGAGRFEIDVFYDLTMRNTLTNGISRRSGTRTVNNMDEAIAAIYEMQQDMLGTHDEIVAESRIFTPQPQAGFVLMDHHSGHVLAIRGVRGERANASRLHCRATRATRSPGSQLKPLIFAAGFDIGVLSPGSPIEDAPWAVHPQGGQRWEPRNWWRGGFRGFQTARQAIHTSMNVVSARALVDYVGIETTFAYLLNLGFTTLEGVTPDGRTWSDRIPALSLGGLTQGTILLELAGAYATIANEGMYNRPIFYTHVLRQDGTLLLENNHAPRQVLRRETAYLVTHSMMDTLNHPDATGRGQRFENLDMRRDIPLSGKTGTSQHGRDSGFVGYSPYFTGAVWLGFDMPRPLPSNYTRYRENLWRIIMERVHYGMSPRSFERPSGIVTATICRDSGHAVTDLCRSDPRGARLITDIFALGNVPTTPCTVHQQFRICDISGLLAGDTCHPIFVSYRVGLDLPPLPDWAQGTHVPGRQYAFTNAVLERQVCVNCQFHYHDWFNPQEPDYGYHDTAPPEDDVFNWPWNPQPPSGWYEQDTSDTDSPGYDYHPAEGDPPQHYYPTIPPPYPPPDDDPYATGDGDAPTYD